MESGEHFEDILPKQPSSKRKRGPELPNVVVKDQVLVANITIQLQNLKSRPDRKRPKYPSNKAHACPTCGKTFVTPSILKRHMVVHTGEKPHKCSLCDKSYSQVEHLRRHQGSHTGKNIFTCTVCQRTFVEKSRFTDHMMSHLEEAPYRCETCNKGFTHRVGLQKHLKIHAGQKKHECDICHKRFIERQTLRVHRRIHTGEHPYKCPHCLKGFNREKLLTIHLRSHSQDRPFECKLCFKRFTSKQGLTGHSRLHETGGKFPHIADRALVSPESITSVVKSQSPKKNEGPYECKLCSRRFDRKCSLTVHQKALHPHINAQNLTIKCGVCGASFESLLEAQDHVKIHKVEDQTSTVPVPTVEDPDAATEAAQTLQEFSLQCSGNAEAVPLAKTCPLASTSDPMQVVSSQNIEDGKSSENRSQSCPLQSSDQAADAVFVQLQPQHMTSENISYEVVQGGMITTEEASGSDFVDSVEISSSDFMQHQNNTGRVPELSHEQVTFHDQSGIDWSAELAKCPALSAEHGDAWTRNFTVPHVNTDKIVEGDHQWPPGDTTSSAGAKDVAATNSCESTKDGVPLIPSTLRSTAAAEGDKYIDVPDRNSSFLAADILNELLPKEKRKRRRSI